MKTTIHFPGDPSVGIFSTTFEAEIPDPFDEEDREDMRTIIKDCYEALMGDKASWILFDDENFDDNNRLIRR